MYCNSCGNELKENESFCSKCGNSILNQKDESIISNDYGSQSKEKYNLLSIIGVIIAGVSLLLNFYGIVGIAAVIISSIALVKISRTNEKGKVLSIVGISVGGFSILYAFIILLIAVFL